MHHYADGTLTNVAPDEISDGIKGQEYTTNPATHPELLENYEVVDTKLPANANGTLENHITEVIYYYKVKEYDITTEVNGVGGKITGEKETPYESVLHGNNSIKDIVITPDEGYEISKITINSLEYVLPEKTDESYMLKKFENMTEDKHIIVEFIKQDANIIVKHVTEAGIDIVEPEIVNGKVGDEYTTSQKDFKNYEIKIIPENANGNMTQEQIIVTYVYSEVKGKITITKVDSKNDTKLSSAIFKIEKLDENGIVDKSFEAQEKITDDNGLIEFTELLVGTYQITEIKAPDGYELNNEVIQVEVTKAEREINMLVKNDIKELSPATGDIQVFMLSTISVMSTIGIMYMLLNRKAVKK